MGDMSKVRCYLNNRVNVDGNPFDNLYLYKHGLNRKGIYESNPEFYSKERLDEYVKHMREIGWYQPPHCELKNLSLYPGNLLEQFVKWMNGETVE